MSVISAIAPGRSFQMSRTISNDFAIQERSVLSRESALRASASGYDSHTTYEYEIGPDGKRYIVGAEVSIIAPEGVLDSIPGGVGTNRNPKGEISTSAGELIESGSTGNGDDKNEDVIAELKQIEREVVLHEASHKAAAGRFGGPVIYSFTTGPDGKRYISGGSVQIHTPATSDPEEALRNAKQVISAALAPGDPSGPDIAAAANAASIAASARARIASGRSESQHDFGSGSRAAVSGKKIAESYASYLSPRGLWSVSGWYGEQDGADEVNNWSVKGSGQMDIAA
ncbi:MAG: hypothetical protein LBQ58_04425 [Synergistaceae bacterium]|jgi:hypothetical protein|nr:hypothetical protein [Synergistaceae bacterium]